MNEERLHVLQALLGKTATAVGEAVAGDIVAVPKLNDVRMGDTLAPKSAPVSLAPLEVGRPMLSVAIRPKTTGDEDRLMTGLHRLQEEDPALEVYRNDETHQTVLSGTGETHLQVARRTVRLRASSTSRIEQESSEDPSASLWQRRSRAIPEGGLRGRHKKQTGGHGQFGVAQIRIEPLPRGEGFAFVDAVVGGAIPRQFIPAVEKGVLRAMRQGGVFGFPVVDVKVTCYDGKYHPVDSSEASFEMAGSIAFSEALRAADPVALEPITRLEVTVPSRFVGEVLGDVNGRRARVLSSEPNDEGDTVIVALVPTGEISRYAMDLRSLSGGHGRFRTAHDHYDTVPAHLTDKLPRAKVLVS